MFNNTCVVAMIMCAGAVSLFSGGILIGWQVGDLVGKKKLPCKSLIADDNRFDMQCWILQGVFNLNNSRF